MIYKPFEKELSYFEHMHFSFVSYRFNDGVLVPFMNQLSRLRVLIYTNLRQCKSEFSWLSLPVQHFQNSFNIILFNALPINLRFVINYIFNHNTHILTLNNFLAHLACASLVIELMLLQLNQLYFALVKHKVQLINILQTLKQSLGLQTYIGQLISYTIMNWTEEFPGFISVLSSLKNQPIQQILGKWESKVQNGHIKRLTDQDIDLPVIEISGTNINKNYMAIPANRQKSLKIKSPILVLLVKNMDKYFRFEIGILDNKNIKRTFISCNKQSITRIKPFQCSMPLQLDDGWNQIVFNLDEYCEKAFGTNFVECQRIQVNANCRIARIYFNDTVKSQEQIPPQYKLFMRVQAFKSS